MPPSKPRWLIKPLDEKQLLVNVQSTTGADSPLEVREALAALARTLVAGEVSQPVGIAADECDGYCGKFSCNPLCGHLKKAVVLVKGKGGKGGKVPKKPAKPTRCFELRTKTR